MRNYTLIIVALVAIWLLPCHSRAQQMPVSLGQVLGFHPEHPGYFPETNFNRLSVSYLQNDAQINNWKAASQFLRYVSRPQGESESEEDDGAFSWGLYISNDKVHTEQRFSLSPSIAARILDKGASTISVGISLGFLNWSSNNTDRIIYDPNDVAIPSRNNFLELDAGLGAGYRFKTKKVNANLDFFARQLTGNIITNELPGLRVIPHVFAAGNFLVSPVYNVMVGPRVFFQSGFNDEVDPKLLNAMDFMGVLQFQRQKFEVRGGYRPSSKALLMGFQVHMKKADMLASDTKAPLDIAINFEAYCPTDMGSVFGPSAEVGISLAFRGATPIIEKPCLERADFWRTEGDLTKHKEERMDPNGPPGLKALSEFTDKKVYITYEFPDNSGNYIGDSPVIRGAEVRKIGYEWIGVDGVLENLTTEVIQEALHPDTVDVCNPENLELLKSLKLVGVSAFVKESSEGMGYGSGIVYEGELGHDSASSKILSFKMVVDEKDTIIQVTKGEVMSNLEFASLKLYVMVTKLQYELTKQFGDQYIFTINGEIPLIGDDEEVRPIFYIEKPRLITGSLNQKEFLAIQIQTEILRFGKDKRAKLY